MHNPPENSGDKSVQPPSMTPLVTEHGAIDTSGIPSVDESGMPASRVIGHEHYEVGLRGIFQFFAWFVGMLAFTGVVVYVATHMFQQSEIAAEQPKSALENQSSLPPEPRLQPSRGHETLDEEDNAKMKAEMSKNLSTYGWVDEPAKVARMPINEAIEAVAKDPGTLPARAGGKRPDGRK